VDGRTALVEYSDLPKDLEQARNPDGGLTYWAGSTGVHCLDREFARRIATGEVELAFHRADKRVATVDDPDPQAPNAVKFEAFMFDALPLAARTATVEMAREERFAPGKNAEGAAGVTVPHGAVVEIDPRFAQDPADLHGRVPTDLVIDEPVYFPPPA
jgi:UDP-N-acetylglucosamine/UDP-N-acetylgalactosamine diphosphorylase